MDSNISTNLATLSLEGIQMLKRARFNGKGDTFIKKSFSQPSDGQDLLWNIHLFHYIRMRGGGIVKHEVFTGFVRDTQGVFYCILSICGERHLCALSCNFQCPISMLHFLKWTTFCTYFSSAKQGPSVSSFHSYNRLDSFICLAHNDMMEVPQKINLFQACLQCCWICFLRQISLQLFWVFFSPMNFDHFSSLKSLSLIL